LNKTLIFAIDFRKILKHQTCPVAAKLFHVEEQTDMPKRIVAFANLRTSFKIHYNRYIRSHFSKKGKGDINDLKPRRKTVLDK